MSNDHLSPEGFPTRIYAAAYQYGWPILDSTPLAERLAGGPSCDVDPTGSNPCITKLHPDPERGMLSHSPPFSQSNAHSAVKVPNRPYMLLSDEPGPCPWGWLRYAYIGDETFNETARGDLFPSIVGAFRIPENREEDCAENMAKFSNDPSGDTSFNPHLHLVSESSMFTSWNNAGIRAIEISDPGMPFETGFYFPKPVEKTAHETDKLGLALNSQPVLKDGFIYVMDRVNGVYVFRYTSPLSDEVPDEGLFQQEQTQVPGRPTCSGKAKDLIGESTIPFGPKLFGLPSFRANAPQYLGSLNFV